MLLTSLFKGGTWKLFTAIIFPLIFSPLLIFWGTYQESRCAFVILLMASYWVLEPVPLAVTSLLPIVLFPLLGVISTSEASTPYMNSTNMMFIGGLIMAVAIENCNLHKRIALNVLIRIQPTLSKMMLGFMATSMFLSMWISNTATAALMVPIVDAVLKEFEEQSQRRSSDELPLKAISVISCDSKSVSSGKEEEIANSAVPEIERSSSLTNNADVTNETSQWCSIQKEMNRDVIIRKTMLLSIAYSTNIGGTGTLTGTGPNLIVKGIMEEMFPGSDDLSFDRWMLYNIPVALICVSIAWLFLHFVYLRKIAAQHGKTSKEAFKQALQKKYKEIGSITFREKAVSVLFGILVLLWLFRDPNFIKGWGSYFPKKVKDATPAIAIPFFLFLIPAEPWNMKESPALLDWKTLQAKMPWGIVFLLGGGFSIAEASSKSGLSSWASGQLASFNVASPVALVVVLCLVAAILTEFTSNVATANILLNVIAQLAVATKVNPIFYVLPVTISCSFAFMLPVATPPNAIVYEAGDMKPMDMVLPGIFMNAVCVTIEIIMINFYGPVIFNLNTFPDWAVNSKGDNLILS